MCSNHYTLMNVLTCPDFTCSSLSYLFLKGPDPVLNELNSLLLTSGDQGQNKELRNSTTGVSQRVGINVGVLGNLVPTTVCHPIHFNGTLHSSHQ